MFHYVLCQHGKADGVAGLLVAVDSVEVVVSVAPFGFFKINDCERKCVFLGHTKNFFISTITDI